MKPFGNHAIGDCTVMGERLTAVDPGVRKPLGIAVFENGVLIRAFLHDQRRKFPQRYVIGHDLAIEYPQIYLRSRSPNVNPQDIRDLTAAAENVIVEFESAHRYRPHDWKGSVKKDVMTRRIWNKWMTESERKLCELRGLTAAQRGDVIDAVGVGIHHLRTIGMRR